MSISVVITGCSAGGIGDSLAQEFYRRGFRVFATARNLGKVEHLRVIGCEIVQLDVTSKESIEKAVFEITKATGGKVDFLVNNAGRGHTSPLLDVDLDAAKETFNLNFFSALHVTQAFAPSLIAAKGKVINIGSIGGKIVTPYTGIYAASKAALNLMSETLRVEMAPFDVKVITVVAGTVDTGFYAHQAGIELSKDSIYAPIKDAVEGTRAGTELGKNAMTPARFAHGVVANAVNKNPQVWFWHGTKATLVWIITVFLPHTFLDRALSRASGLSLMKSRLRQGELSKI